MAGAHSSEKRWYKNQNPNGNESVADKVQVAGDQLLDALNRAEQMYGEMQELYAYVGGTMQLLADQLFYEKWSVRVPDPVNAPDVFETQANATEVAMAQDAFNAVTAMHELYQCLTNQTVAAEDRLAQIRRMS